MVYVQRQYQKKCDTSRITKSHRKLSVTGKKRRKALRAKKKGLVDKEKEFEPKESCVTGGY